MVTGVIHKNMAAVEMTPFVGWLVTKILLQVNSTIGYLVALHSLRHRQPDSDRRTDAHPVHSRTKRTFTLTELILTRFLL